MARVRLLPLLLVALVLLVLRVPLHALGMTRTQGLPGHARGSRSGPPGDGWELTLEDTFDGLVSSFGVYLTWLSTASSVWEHSGCQVGVAYIGPVTTC